MQRGGEKASVACVPSYFHRREDNLNILCGFETVTSYHSLLTLTAFGSVTGSKLFLLRSSLNFLLMRSEFL